MIWLYIDENYSAAGFERARNNRSTPLASKILLHSDSRVDVKDVCLRLIPILIQITIVYICKDISIKKQSSDTWSEL